MKKLLSLVLSAVLLASCVSICLPAYSAVTTDYDINPFYEDYIDADTLFKKSPPYSLNADSVAESSEVFTDYKSAAMFVRDCMVKRIERVDLTISKNAKDNLTDVYRHDVSSKYYVVYGAFCYDIAHLSNDGDYLQNHYRGASCTMYEKTDVNYYQFTLRYDTNAEEEQEVTAFVKSFTSSLKAKNLTRLQQIKAIHDKICSITEYDWDSYYNGSVEGDSSINTAYSAVKYGKTMCEGYSELFYYMCREMNIPVRIVHSDTHAWNLVKPIDSKYYYNIDVTWDDYEYPDEDNPYDCGLYLKSDYDTIHRDSHRGLLPDDNDDHNRVDYYNSAYFNSHFPISENSFYLNDSSVARCAYCNAAPDGVQPTVNEHTYSVKTTVAATCINNGAYVYTCSHCGDSYTEPFGPTGVHKYNIYNKYCLYGCGKLNEKYTVKPVAISSLKAKKKAAAIKWKKGTGTGYQLQYSTSKKFKKSATKTVKIKKASTFSKTVKKLKSGKKYYFRIRSYDTFKGKTVYSKWSKTKAVKAK